MDKLTNSNNENILLKKLERALFYEVQYRNAIVSGALSYYDVNVSKNLIENDFFFKNEYGEITSVLEYVGLKAPCKFTDFIKCWTNVMIPEENRKEIKGLNNITETLMNVFQDGKRDFTVEYWANRKNGKDIYLNQKFLLTQNEAGEVCALSIVKDFTDIVASKERPLHKDIEKYAYTDPITQGYNYIKFKERLNEQRNSGVIVSMDIHSFKIINSICGVTKGDEVIKEMWNVILNAIDTNKDELAGHINADLFIIFMPTYDSSKILRRIKNLTYALKMVSINMQVPELEPYFGIAFWQPGKRIELSYSESVAAKSNAKNNANQNYAFFEEQDTARLVWEKQVADSFEIALNLHEFKLWYQPKFNPVDRTLVGAEALVRWIQKDGKIIPPGDFIPIFEKNGMIRKLDEYIFRNVCMQQMKWKEAGLNIVPVSINLSRASLYYKSLVKQYKHIAKEIGIDSKYIPIEITETAAVNTNDIKTIADQFYKAGFILHMDDFGSGYSSLSSLNLMHFDTLKLDKSLIDYIGNFGGDRLIEHTISLAKELGIHVTAEGVENENQVSFLNHIGCDSIQGYFYSKPVPLDDFTKILKDNSVTKTQEELHKDTIIKHVTRFRHNISKPPIYSFVVNLSQNKYQEGTGHWGWNTNNKIKNNDYDESIVFLSENYVLPEYKEKYLSFMNRQKRLDGYKGYEETSILTYKRKLTDQVEDMQMIAQTFKLDYSDDLFMYCSINLLE